MSIASKIGQAITKGAGAVAPLLPTGTYSIDPDGVKRYTLSDDDIRKLRNVISGALKDNAGKPSIRLSRVDEAVVPAVLGRFGLPVAAVLGGVFLLGRLSGGRR
jgi:hypothetical protein